MSPLAIATFFQTIFGALVAIPIIILWVVAVVDVFRHGFTGLKIAALLVLILIVPILGPILYFVFARPPDDIDPEAAYRSQADLAREAGHRPIGGPGLR